MYAIQCIAYTVQFVGQKRQKISPALVFHLEKVKMSKILIIMFIFILITKWLKHDLTAPGSIITLFQVCNLQPRSRLVGLCTTDREGNHNHDWHNPEVSKTSMHCSLYLKIGHQSKKTVTNLSHRWTCRCSSLDPSPERPSPCLKSHLNNFPFLKAHLKLGNQMQKPSFIYKYLWNR